MSNLPVSAIIMAGGKGTRLLPLTKNLPKPLLKINQKPILAWIIELLWEHQITDISVSVSYLAESIIEFLRGDEKYASIKILAEETPLDDIGILGITNANCFENESLLVINADLFTNVNLSSFYQNFLKNNSDMAIATFVYKAVIPYGLISSENSEVIRIDEKPILEMEANGGIYLFKKDLLHLIPNDKPYNAWQFINQLLNEKTYKLSVFLIEDLWIDIGSKESYERAEEVARSLDRECVK